MDFKDGELFTYISRVKSYVDGQQHRSSVLHNKIRKSEMLVPEYFQMIRKTRVLSLVTHIIYRMGRKSLDIYLRFKRIFVKRVMAHPVVYSWRYK
jgi:hypothetical protein